MNHDVIIIGGGPAGSTAAMTLAQAGRRVLVLEKEKFPRFHIGESLLPYNVLLFQKLGVWPKIEAGGFMPKRGAQFLSGSDPRHIRINFGDGAFTECPAAIQVERSRFDQILLEHARECGAEVREQCLVLSHEITADGVSVKYRNADGVVGEERAAFLIDASGLSNFTANRAGERKIYPTHKKVAIFGHFTGVEMPTGECYGDILIVRRRNSWSWLIPLSEEKTSVGLVVDAADLKSSGMAPADLFSSAMEDTPALKQRMQHATRVGDMHVLSDFSYKNDALVAPRLVRAGDASGFIDPIFSSGVFLATTSGHWGALAVHEALQQGRTMTPAMRRFERDTRRRISVYWQFIEGFYTDPFTQLFFEPQDFMKLPSAINCVLAGRADLPFSAKWRLWLFFFLVWVQKRWPLTPRVEIRS
jgi:flavin-dependent dehydrogenase